MIIYEIKYKGQPVVLDRTRQTLNGIPFNCFTLETMNEVEQIVDDMINDLKIEAKSYTPSIKELDNFDKGCDKYHEEKDKNY